jgi:hypothetical protein
MNPHLQRHEFEDLLDLPCLIELWTLVHFGLIQITLVPLYCLT